MLLRIICAVSGVGLCCVLSQFPEFSQQYLQRLAGAVDELSRAVRALNSQASALGMTVPEFFQSLSGTESGQAVIATFKDQIARQAELSAALSQLREAGPVERILAPTQYYDAGIAAAAWSDFKPAVPLTIEGLAFGSIGYGLGAMLGTGVYNFGRVFRRKKTPKLQTAKTEPAFMDAKDHN